MTHSPSRCTGIALRALVGVAAFAAATSASQAAPTPINLPQAVQIVLANDLTLESLRKQAQAAAASARTAGILPPPKLGFKLANVPTNDWAFDREPMTQLGVSYLQPLPPSGLLDAMEARRLRSADILDARAALRLIELRRSVQSAWINAWEAVNKHQIFSSHRAHLEQLLAAAESKYRAGVRRSSQQDVLSLRTAISGLELQIDSSNTALITARESLREWMSGDELLGLDFVAPSAGHSTDRPLEPDLSRHPAVEVKRAEVAQAEADREIAVAQNRAARSVSFSYAYRADSEAGVTRSDLFSVGFSVELPSLRPAARRHRLEAASNALDASMLSSEQLRLAMLSDYKSLVEINYAITEQIDTLTKEVLPQTRQQTDSLRGAYAGGEAGFAQVQRAQFALMEHEISLLALQSRQYHNNVTLEYIAGTSPERTRTTP